MGAKKTVKRVTKMIDKADVTIDDILAAGVGVLAKAAKKDKKKPFKKAVSRGRDVLDLSIEALDDVLYADTGIEMIVGYEHIGGGWFAIDIEGTVVDRVQGEEEAASRAGELMEAFAAVDDPDTATTGVVASGGGWYEITVHGVPIDRVQGEDAANDRFAEIESLNA